MPMEMPSYGESTASTLRCLYEEVRMSSMRFCAVPPSQRRVVTWFSAVCLDWTTSCFLSMYGWSTLIAPLKKYRVLLSSLEPANSSMLNGPFFEPSFRPSFSRM